MNALLEKIRKARETQVEVEGVKYTILRPTDLDVLDMQYSGTREAVEGISKFVIGWDLKEIDIIPGGRNVPIDYDRDLFNEYIADKPGSWSGLIEAVRNTYKTYTEGREVRAKN